MSIKSYANRVRETSTTVGSGNLVLAGAPLGYRSFVSSIGADNKLTYYIYRSDTNFEWEIGVGYILSTGGVDQLVRERIVTSSNGGLAVGFTTGTKLIETIISEDRVNTSFINVEEKSSNFTPPYIPATYIIDASVTGVQVSLPAVAAEDDAIVLGFVLNKTIGSVDEQSNAIQLVASGTETIAGTGSIDVSILNDYLQIISVPSQSGWLLLDPIQDATNPYGNNGTVQFKYDNAFSGVNAFTWDSSNKLLIGNSGVASADIVLPASSSQTTIFNQNLYDNDLRIAGSGISHLVFVDGGLGRVGINTSSVTDTLSVNGSTGSGLTVSRSGVGPALTLNNTSVSGVTSNNIVGSVRFNGLSNTNSSVIYGSILSNIESNINNAEYSNVSIETLNNGAIEEIAVFSPSGVTLGSNSQNIDGVVIGAGSTNEGNNIVGGYFNNVCGENCVVLGDNVTLSSGTFGGAIGSNHAVSGTNLWILGGSGVTASGNNKTLVALDDDNYLEIQQSGNIKYSTLSDQDVSFVIENTSILLSGVNQDVTFTFNNSSGIMKTGLLIRSEINDIVSGTEDSSYVVKILASGNQSTILDLHTDSLVVGTNSTSGNNIVFGTNNLIGSGTNIVYGSDIVATGTNNILVGKYINLSSSSSNSTIVGQNNDCSSSGNLGIVMLGNGNEASEDYGILMGIDNATSGLYSVACGYLNGAHGDYSVSIGESNLINSNYSVAVGRNNNLDNTNLSASLFAVGVGNTANISNTGVLVGYLNEIYGSGGCVVGSNINASGLDNVALGNNIAVTGLDNIIIGNDVSFSGNSTTLLQNTSIKISGVTDITGNASNSLRVSTTGISVSGVTDIIANTNNSIRISTTGTYVKGNTGFNQSNPSYTVDISGVLRVSNTGTGIVYENCPSSSGSGVYSLVIQNNIIQSGDGGVLVTSTLPSTSISLSSTSKKFQILDPGSTNTYNVTLNVANMYEGREFYIRNISDNLSTEPMNIIDGFTTNTLVTLGGGNSYRGCNVVFDGTKWVLVMVGE